MLTVTYLKQLLNYDPLTGIFTWKVSRNRRIKIGQVAGYTNSPVPHRRIEIDGKSFGEHRLAWLYVYGYFPSGVIDHIDGNPSNNRINNLRDCTHSENLRNTKLSKTNTSEDKGVYWHTRDSVWYASASFMGKLHHLGCFTNKADAITARKRLESDNFGKFSYGNSQEISKSSI